MQCKAICDCVRNENERCDEGRTALMIAETRGKGPGRLDEPGEVRLCDDKNVLAATSFQTGGTESDRRTFPS